MKQLTTVALVCISYFVIVIIIFHFLRPELSPIGRPTSEYAVGPYGFLMTTAFFSMSAASFSLLVGLHKGIASPAQSRIGLFLLGIWGVGVLVAMTFRIDPEGSELTTAGTIHRINGPLSFLSLTLSAFLISRSFRRDVNWQPFYHSALTLSLIMIAMFIITGVNVTVETGFGGLCQRTFLVVFVTWFILTTLHLRTTIANYQ